MEFISNLFSKHKVKCPDGSVRYVYRNIDKAFPMFLGDIKNEISAGIKNKEFGSANATKKYNSDIRSILIQIDETNQSMMLNFRVAYIGFESNPCQNSEKFNADLDEIRRCGQHNHELKVKVNAIIRYLELGGNHSKEIETILCEISASYPQIALPSAAALEMREAEKNAGEMAEQPE